jgi:hypothetical protein
MPVAPSGVEVGEIDESWGTGLDAEEFARLLVNVYTDAAGIQAQSDAGPVKIQ